MLIILFMCLLQIGAKIGRFLGVPVSKSGEAGVVSGYNSTTEAAVTKLMFLLGQGMTVQQVKEHLQCSLVGEIDN